MHMSGFLLSVPPNYQKPSMQDFFFSCLGLKWRYCKWANFLIFSCTKTLTHIHNMQERVMILHLMQIHGKNRITLPRTPFLRADCLLECLLSSFKISLCVFCEASGTYLLLMVVFLVSFLLNEAIKWKLFTGNKILVCSFSSINTENLTMYLDYVACIMRQYRGYKIFWIKIKISKGNHWILRIGAVGRCQQVPKFDFQSQFPIKKSSEFFSFFFIEEYQFRSTFFVIEILW